MAFNYVADERDIPVGEKKVYHAANEKILLIHLPDGFYATQAKCPHMSLPLEKGHIVGDGHIRCHFHRAEFDVRTGAVCEWANFPPGIQLLNIIRGEKPLNTYKVKVEDGKVYVDY
ncbi:MAG: Rieske 2Fe-2S domain-containing protein [Gammaproteobacteria bacterium]